MSMKNRKYARNAELESKHNNIPRTGLAINYLYIKLLETILSFYFVHLDGIIMNLILGIKFYQITATFIKKDSIVSILMHLLVYELHTFFVSS